jgi:hypothetical protein
MKRFVSISVTALALVAMIGCASSPSAEAKPVSEAVAPAGVEQGKVPAGEVHVVDAFEDGNYWQAVGDTWDQWGEHNLSLTAEVTGEWKSEGANALDCTFDNIPAPARKGTFFCDNIAIDGEAASDFTGYKFLVVDVKNPETVPLNIGLNIQSGANWENWVNGATVTVAPGETTIVFDLANGLTDGNNAALKSLPGASQIKRLMISVYGAKEGTLNTGHFYMDNIRLIK